jgi:hypothetical protein
MIIEKILNKIKIPNLIELLVNRLSFGELQSLLLKTFELKISKKNCSEILTEFQSNRFVKLSDINPILHRNFELDIFSFLPDGFEIIDLSPLAPLGTSSVLATVHQNNVISTIRNVEVAADTTNILALECAKRRLELLNKNTKCTDTVKLCSSQRVTRGQPFKNKNFSAYFNIIALCTAGRDEGNDYFELVNLKEHIKFYINIIEQIIDRKEVKQINIKFYEYGEYDNTKLFENIRNMLINHDNIFFKTESNSEFGKNYYTRLRFMISVVDQNDQEYDYIDGGFTDWTCKILSNKKERLLTSGIGTDLIIRTIKVKTTAYNNF